MDSNQLVGTALAVAAVFDLALIPVLRRKRTDPAQRTVITFMFLSSAAVMAGLSALFFTGVLGA